MSNNREEVPSYTYCTIPPTYYSRIQYVTFKLSIKFCVQINNTDDCLNSMRVRIA